MLDYTQSTSRRIEELEANTYTQSDLGMTLKEGVYTFKVWSPLADEVYLNIYATGDINEETLIKQIKMNDEGNVWSISLEEDLDGLFYTYAFNHQNYQTEAPDLYSKAVGINGDRTAIINLAETDPENWEHDEHVMQRSITDAVIWEVHVEDFSSDATSGISPDNQGKYLAFTEEDTTLYSAGEFPTGVNYLAKLGINYVHLLPVFDFVNDEEDANYYNWGYDPKNYFVPEGKYSSDPRDPKARITELKQLIQSLHRHDIGVVLDIVLNHTYYTEESWFEKTVPGYYYRKDKQGNFSNGSGVGNETASERTMMRKYMIDNLLYWVEEYHVDGFRFDLMGVHDTETMNEIRSILDERGYEDVILYGEPWAGGHVAMPEGYYPADRNHIHDFSENIAVFNSDFRDAIKGHVFIDHDPAFLQGKNGRHDSNFSDADLIAAIMAHTEQDAGEYQLPDYKVWARYPKEVLNYSSVHDNFTLYDKLVLSTSESHSYERQEQLVKMNKINAAILLTSQGGILFQAGEEFARTKYGNPNSYNAPIATNHLDWSRARDFQDLVDYYRGMIKIRADYPPFRDETRQTADMMYFLHLPENILGYTIPNLISKDSKWDNIFVGVNTSDSPYSIDLPKDSEGHQQTWTVLADINQVNPKGMGKIRGESLILNPDEVYILAIER
jgi:pullulanase